MRCAKSSLQASIRTGRLSSLVKLMFLYLAFLLVNAVIVELFLFSNASPCTTAHRLASKICVSAAS